MKHTWNNGGKTLYTLKTIAYNMAKLIFFYKLLFRRVQKMPYWHEYMYNHPRHYLGDKSSSGSYNGVC